MRLRAPSVILALLMAGVLGACSVPETEQELLARAADALRDNQIEAAVVDIKTALQQNPDSGAARLLLGETYMRQHDPSAASAEFRRAFESGGGVESQVRYAQARVAAGDTGSLLASQRGEGTLAAGEARYLAAVARAHALEGDAEAARAAIEKALDIDATDPYTRVSEALLLLRLGDNRFDAAAILARITDEHPDYDEAWSVRADVARLEQDFASAAEWYEKAVTLNPYRLADRLQLVGMQIELGETEDADRKLAELEKLMPDHPGVNFARGRLLVNAGQHEEGLQELSRVLSVLPNHSATLYLAATANAREGNLATAQSQLAKFSRDHPDNIPARLQMASLYLRQDDASSAERIARDVLKENDMNTTAMRLLALALATQGLYAESAQVYQELARLDASSIEDRAGLGAAQLLSGEVELGVGELEEALAMNPNNKTLHERLINVYLTLGNVDAARAALADYRAISDHGPRQDLLAGRVELESGNRDEARRHFQAVVAKDPGSIAANGGLAVMALAESDFDDARNRFNAILKANPAHIPTWMNLAVLEEEAGNMDAMFTSLESAITTDVDALQPRLALARYRIGQGNPGEAVPLLEEVREKHADTFELHQVLASAYLGTGQPEKSIASGEEMLRLRPEDPSTLAQLARFEKLAGKPGKARDYVEQALSLVPDDVVLRKMLVEMLLAERNLEGAAAELAKLPPETRDQPGVAAIEGRIALVQQRPGVAKAAFQKVFDADPTGSNLRLLATSLWEEGDREASIAALEGWLAEHIDDHAVRNELAARQLVIGEEDEARKHYLRLLEIAPDDPGTLNNVAWLHRDIAPEKALEYVVRAHELLPDNGKILGTYAMVQRSLGNSQEALDLSKRALAAAGQVDPWVKFNRALILADAGRSAEAIELLEGLVSGPVFPRQSDARALLDSLR